MLTKIKFGGMNMELPLFFTQRDRANQAIIETKTKAHPNTTMAEQGSRNPNIDHDIDPTLVSEFEASEAACIDNYNADRNDSDNGTKKNMNRTIDPPAKAAVAANNSKKQENLQDKCWLIVTALSCLLIVACIVAIALLYLLSPAAVPATQKSNASGYNKSRNNNNGKMTPPQFINKERKFYYLTLREYLWNNTSTYNDDVDVFLRPNSPQKLALHFMAFVDTPNKQKYKDSTELLPTIDDLYLQSSHFLQRYALLVLYYSNSGQNWNFPISLSANRNKEKYEKLSSSSSQIDNKNNDDDIDTTLTVFGWGRKADIIDDVSNHHIHECDWQFITCDDNEQVVKLDLSVEGVVLAGQLPKELSLLTNLQELNLSNNRLEGTFPSQIYNLIGLEGLDLSNNEFVGALSTNIGKLSNLSYLSLSGNLFSGQIPETFDQLTKLEQLQINKNPNIFGPIFNHASNWPEIKHIDISYTHISGTIPTEISALSNLNIFAAYKAALNGTLPTELGMTKLEQLVLGEMKDLSGTIPTEIGMISRNLKTLLFTDINLSGTIPTEIGNLREILVLGIKNNNIGGTLPTEVGYLSNLVTLAINNNDALSGIIPTELELLPNLVSLQLEYTSLHGKVPDKLCLADNLEIKANCINNITVQCSPHCCQCIGGY